VLEKERKCTYNNTNAIIGLLMCTVAWINVKVSPVIAAMSMLDKCKGDRKRRPQVQTQVNGTPMEALVDSGASVSVMSKRAFKTVWEHWKMQRLPIPAALNVSGVNGEKIDVTGLRRDSSHNKGREDQRGQVLHEADPGAVGHRADRPHPRL
jgi:hypothetical protein